MDTKSIKEVNLQRCYYAATARHYNAMHVQHKDEHILAQAVMVDILDYFDIEWVLDIGSGTGRVIHYLKRICPTIHIRGIEPIN